MYSNIACMGVRSQQKEQLVFNKTNVPNLPDTSILNHLNSGTVNVNMPSLTKLLSPTTQAVPFTSWLNIKITNYHMRTKYASVLTLLKPT